MELKDKKITIKNIVIPYLDDAEKYLYIGQMKSSQIELINFIVNPRSFKNIDRVLYVKRDWSEDINYFSIIPTIAEKDLINGGEPIEIIKFRYREDWVLVPLMIYFLEKREDFKQMFKSKLNGHGVPIPLNCVDLSKEIIVAIRQAYNDTFGRKRINDTSLLLYSGPNKGSINRNYISSLFCDISSHDKEVSDKVPIDLFQEKDTIVIDDKLKKEIYNRVGCLCLYTGDITIKGVDKEKRVLSAYSDYHDYIGLIQVPHHGSATSANNKFLEEFANRKAFYSYGISNKYGHLNISLLKTLWKNKITVMGVKMDGNSNGFQIGRGYVRQYTK